MAFITQTFFHIAQKEKVAAINRPYKLAFILFLLIFVHGCSAC